MIVSVFFCSKQPNTKMTEQEKHNEIVRANSQYKMGLMNHKKGKISDTELARLKAVLDTLKGIAPTEAPAPPTVVAGNNLAAELQKKIADLDKEKNIVCNQLVSLPENENGLKLQETILSLREKIMEAKDDLRHVLQFGKLPEEQKEVDPVEIVKSLPNDRYEVDKTLRYQRARLSKYRAKHRTAKTDKQRNKYLTLIHKTEAEIEHTNNFLKKING